MGIISSIMSTLPLVSWIIKRNHAQGNRAQWSGASCRSSHSAVRGINRRSSTSSSSITSPELRSTTYAVHLSVNVTGGLETPEAVTTTGTVEPDAIPGGIDTFTW